MGLYVTLVPDKFYAGKPVKVSVYIGKNRDEYSVELTPDVTLVPCPSVHLWVSP